MKITAKQLKNQYDYVIIGSGFGGSVSALRLAEKGYSVLVIEKGKWFEAKDFPKTNWQLKKYFWLPSLRFFGFLKLTFFRHVGILSGVGVGGGSLVYANTLPRPASAFFNSGNWEGLANWEEELEAHYQTAEMMLGAAKNPKLFSADETLRAVSVEMNAEKHFDTPKVAVYFGKPNQSIPDPYFNGKGPERSGCQFCGQCMTGCPHNAKNTLDKNYLHLALGLGVDVLAEHQVQYVKEEAGGYQVGFKASTKRFGKKTSVKANGVVFSGGVLGTTRLLLDMKTKGYLSNLSCRVGQYVRTNNENLSLVTSNKKDLDMSKGVAIGSIFPPDKDGHVEAVRYGEGSNFWKIPIIPMVYGKSMAHRLFKLLKILITNPRQWLGLYFKKDFAKRTVILLFMQHLDSTIQFTRGRFNLKSKLTNGIKPTPFIGKAKVIAQKVARKTGGHAYMMSTDVIFGTPSTAHILGGAVMGKDKDSGVIDAYHRVYGYKNLYVCDGSAMSANPGVNPSLTITAMTERAMHHIPRKA